MIPMHILARPADIYRHAARTARLRPPAHPTSGLARTMTRPLASPVRYERAERLAASDGRVRAVTSAPAHPEGVRSSVVSRRAGRAPTAYYDADAPAIVTG